MTGQVVGYARTAWWDQTLELQTEALTEARCTDVFCDRTLGDGASGTALERALAAVGDGDVLCVWSLCCLERSINRVLPLVAGLNRRGVAFRSLSDDIDTSSVGGQMALRAYASVASFGRRVPTDHDHGPASTTPAAMAGRGRPRSLTPELLRCARALLDEVDDRGQAAFTYDDVARRVGTSRATLYRYLGAR